MQPHQRPDTCQHPGTRRIEPDDFSCFERGRSLIAPPLSIASYLLLSPYRGHGSLRGRKGPPQDLVRSTVAVMSTAGSHGVSLVRPKALRRSRLHPRPVGQLSSDPTLRWI